MEPCVFCKIISGEIPTEILFEDAQTMAFLDLHPRAPGHTLIIPKNHAATITELPDSTVGPLFLTVKRFTGILDKALAPDGFTIGINHGEAAGQAVNHLHVHLIPRFTNDGGGNIHSIVSVPSDTPLSEIAARIKKQQ